MARKDSPSSSPTNAHDSTPDSSPTSALSPGMAASTAQMRSEAPLSAVGQVMAGGAATSEAPLVIVRPGANASVPAGNGGEYFSCGSMVRCVTCHDVTIEGHVMAFDPQTRVLAISKYPTLYTTVPIHLCEMFRVFWFWTMHSDWVQNKTRNISHKWMGTQVHMIKSE